MEQEAQRKLLSDDNVPFAPTVTAAPAEPERAVAAVERVLGWANRWRIPLALFFVALIGVAGVSAYESKQPGDPVLTIPAEEGEAGRAGALSVAVGEVAASNQESPDGSVGPSAPSTSERRSDDSSPTTTRTTIRRTTSSRPRVASSVSRPATSSVATASTSRSSTTGQPSITGQTSSSPTTTEVATTSQAPTTAAPTSSTTAPPSGPATISGRITFDTGSGQAVNGLRLTLYNDTNSDGKGDTIRLRDFTNSSGRYSWQVDAGCYLVDFIIPGPQRSLSGPSETPVCVTPGSESANNNLIITPPSVAPPDYCEIQIGTESWAGVEIHDSGSNWAPSYNFYGSGGRFLLNTTSLGPYDDFEPSEPSIEWTSSGRGFEESDVYSVAAVHEQGVPSSRVTCKRT